MKRNERVAGKCGLALRNGDSGEEMGTLGESFQGNRSEGVEMVSGHKKWSVGF